MNLLLDRIARPSRTLTLALTLVVLAVPATRSHAQYFGYPGFGYGGFGYPGFGYGGFGGFGVGVGYPSVSAYGPGYGFSSPAVGLPYGGPIGVSYYNPLAGGYGYGYGYFSPTFGVGLTPLGIDSALTERYILGRGLPRYSSSYGTVRPSAPGYGAVRPSTPPNVGAAAGTGAGAGAGVNRP